MHGAVARFIVNGINPSHRDHRRLVGIGATKVPIKINKNSLPDSYLS